MQQPVVRVGEWLVTPSINQISRNGRQLTLVRCTGNSGHYHLFFF
ncbi:hypothetical protein, partial [Shigella sonnei]